METQTSRILVVDDSRLNIQIVSQTLREDYKIMAATGFQQAMVALASSTPPDLILLDVMMPDVDGFEACRRIKADQSLAHIPIIFLTSSEDYDNEVEGLSLGAVDFITKPIVPEVLRARVRTQIRLRRQSQDLESAYALIKEQSDRMEKELHLGKLLQEGLLPSLPQDPRFSMAATMESALEVSGDFYDVFFLDQDRLCFCIGDVSDKGVPAALFMSMCKSLIRSKAEKQRSTAHIVSVVNKAIIEYNQACMFVTMVLGILDTRTGELIYTNAGHCHPLTLSDGAISKLSARHGLPIGIMDGSYEEQKLVLKKGASFVCVTDGVTEASNRAGEQLGDDGLASHLSESRASDPNEILDVIKSMVTEFQSGADRSDDMTLLAVRFDGSPELVDQPDFTLTLSEQDLVPGVLGECLKQFLSSSGMTERLHNLLYLVLDELTTNVINYGKEVDRHLDIYFGLTVETDRVVLHVSDNGAGFNLLEANPADVSSGLFDRNAGGLGIHLCRQLMDQITYERRESKNHLTLVKQITSEDTATSMPAHR